MANPSSTPPALPLPVPTPRASPVLPLPVPGRRAQPPLSAPPASGRNASSSMPVPATVYGTRSPLPPSSTSPPCSRLMAMSSSSTAASAAHLEAIREAKERGKERQMHSGTYPILARMARDILAVPASTVASESAFSTSERVVNDYRSRLKSETIEALICLQDWLRSEDSTLENIAGDVVVDDRDCI